jgi:hypothetical protein
LYARAITLSKKEKPNKQTNKQSKKVRKNHTKQKENRFKQ